MAEISERRLVWDLPTRIFHWGIVLLIGFSWWSAETHRMEWHYRSGLTICFFVLFRILWGIVGTDTARFSHFVKGPRAVLDYLRPREGAPVVTPLGHNPVGGWNVIVLIALMAMQVTLGLFAVDVDGIESGPLSFLVDFDQGRRAAELHEAIFNLLIIFSVIHIAAVLFYLVVRRRNLVTPMVTGYDNIEGKDASAQARKAPSWRFAAAAIVALAFTWAVSKGFWL